MVIALGPTLRPQSCQRILGSFLRIYLYSHPFQIVSFAIRKVLLVYLLPLLALPLLISSFLFCLGDPAILNLVLPVNNPLPCSFSGTFNFIVAIAAYGY